MTMNVEKEAAHLTEKIIKHFRSKVSGHGYFYLEEEWAVNKIIKEHLQKFGPGSDTHDCPDCCGTGRRFNTHVPMD